MAPCTATDAIGVSPYRRLRTRRPRAEGDKVVVRRLIDEGRPLARGSMCLCM